MRLPYIDGLKGLGALMVFFTHYRMMGLFTPFQEVWENPLLTFIMSGNIAVELFIMVSGYSLSLSVERKINSLYALDCLKSVINKRYFRLALPVAFLLMLEGALYPIGIFYPHDVAEQLGAHPTAVKAYQSLSYRELMQGVLLSPIGKTYGWLSPAWMLSYIFYGTFMVVILKIAAKSMPITGRVVVYILFSALFSALSMHYLAVVIGCALSEIKIEQIAQSGYKGNVIAIVAILMAGFVHIFIKADIGHTLIAFLLISGVFFTKCLQKLFSKNIALWTGEISFSMYLIHWPLICSFSVWEYQLLDGFNIKLQAIIVFISTTTLLFFLSKLYYDYVENRLCSSLMSRITKWLK